MLTLAALNNLPIMLPSRDEQKQIVVEAQRLIKEAEQLSKAAKDHRAEAQKLVGKLFQGGV